MADTITVDQLAGHWYAIAGSPGFLDRSPRVERVEGFAVPIGESAYRFSCSATSTEREHFFDKVVTSSRGDDFSRCRFRGTAVLMRSWRLTLSPDLRILRSTHPGSMLIPGGDFLFAKVELSESEARAAIATSAVRLGLTARDVETLVWRKRPDGIRLGEVPAFATRPRLGWLAALRAMIGTSRRQP